MEQLELELREREKILRTAKDTVAEKEISLTARDEAIASLQHESSSIVDQLKV